MKSEYALVQDYKKFVATNSNCSAKLLAEILQVSVRTINRWQQKFANGGSEALNRISGQGRKKKLNEEAIKFMIELAKLGHSSSFIAEKIFEEMNIKVSYMTIIRALKKTDSRLKDYKK